MHQMALQFTTAMLSKNTIKSVKNEWEDTDELMPIFNRNLELETPWSYETKTIIVFLYITIYRAIENTLKAIIEQIDNEKFSENYQWHKSLVNKGYTYGLIPAEAFSNIKKMLQIRHVYLKNSLQNLKDEEIKTDNSNTMTIFYQFTTHLKNKFNIKINLKNQKTLISKNVTPKM